MTDRKPLVIESDSVAELSSSDTLVVPGTGGMKAPSGTTAQRVATEGYLRYNTDDDCYEYYNGSAWVQLEAMSTGNYFGDGSLGAVTYSSTQSVGSGDDDEAILVSNYTDLTVNSGVIITPAGRRRAWVIYVSGTLTLNGTISMAKGAKRAGDTGINVTRMQLGEVGDMTWVTHATGATGGAGGTSNAGNPGTAATNGQTGGGGAGGRNGSGTSGSGGTGTESSGGCGGGGAITSTAGSGSSAGSTGGAGAGNHSGGGAGNPGGAGGGSGSAGGTGTGGTLIIIANAIVFTSGAKTMTVNGTAGGNHSSTGGGGGGSGGGRAIVLTATAVSGTYTLNAPGGSGGTGASSSTGGAGGAGWVSPPTIIEAA